MPSAEISSETRLRIHRITMEGVPELLPCARDFVEVLAYLKAIDPEISAKKQEEIRKNLLKYCKHDTEAMARLVHFFHRQ